MNMQELEMKAQMRMQLDVIKLCFSDCINGFKDDQLSSTEKSCVQNCAKRQVNTMMIIGEAQQSMMARQGGMQGGQNFWTKEKLLKDVIIKY